ncbi:MAG: hypothetical protein KJ579_03665 [Verrucomicrobia bacterium]|nr:hypothetical protein [Verrucomicrobiota bacterium]
MRTTEKAADPDTVSVRDSFRKMGLDPAEVLEGMSHDPERESRCLRALLRWATAYRRQGSRQALEKNGFLFPPVQPGIDQDTDWLRFESWVTGRKNAFPMAECGSAAELERV